MLANHTYVGQNGKQNTVFPFEYMYLTQGEGGSYSHAGTYAMDFQGMSTPSTRMLRCPYYAPVDLRLVAIADSANHSYVYTSLDKVNFVDGTYDYFTILVAHDDTSYSVGRIVAQGFELGKTGTYGIATGDHVHMEVKRGTYEGLIQNLQGNYMLKNSTHLYDLFGVNDTVLLVDGGYNWQEFSDSPFPYSSRRTSFPWVLYARKKRQNIVK
jgi:hypothetical protein